MQEFNSKFSIGEEVEPSMKKIEFFSPGLTGTIIAVRFTKSKVFYDVLSDETGSVTNNIPSSSLQSKDYKQESNLGQTLAQ